MKAMLLAVALALPGVAAATVAMDPQQVAPSSQASAPAPSHHQLFTLKYVLRLERPNETSPDIVMDDGRPSIVPPAGSNIATAELKGVDWHPNVTICHDWGCENPL